MREPQVQPGGQTVWVWAVQALVQEVGHDVLGQDVGTITIRADWVGVHNMSLGRVVAALERLGWTVPDAGSYDPTMLPPPRA